MLTVEGLFQNHRRLMESVARRYVPIDDVPDVLQSVAVTLCQKLHTFRAESQVQTWLFMVVRNAAVSHVRGSMRSARLAEAYQRHVVEQDSAWHQDQALIDAQHMTHVQEAIERLPREHATTIRATLDGRTRGLKFQRREAAFESLSQELRRDIVGRRRRGI